MCKYFVALAVLIVCVCGCTNENQKVVRLTATDELKDGSVIILKPGDRVAVQRDWLSLSKLGIVVIKEESNDKETMVEWSVNVGMSKECPLPRNVDVTFYMKDKGNNVLALGVGNSIIKPGDSVVVKNRIKIPTNKAVNIVIFSADASF